MGVPKIKVGDTVRISKKGIFAPFVRKGDVATVTDLEFDGDCVQLWLHGFGWPLEQTVTIGTGIFDGSNKYTTFLHPSQKLVDKPEE